MHHPGVATYAAKKLARGLGAVAADLAQSLNFVFCLLIQFMAPRASIVSETGARQMSCLLIPCALLLFPVR